MLRVLGPLALLAGSLNAVAAQPGPIVIRAGLIHPVSVPAIHDGVIVVSDGRISAVGPADTMETPPHATVLQAAVVLPGLIDARSTVGLSGMLNQREDQDALDKSAPIQPALRALDAYNPRDELVAHLRSFGVTTINTGPAPGTLVPGQTAVFKLHGRNADADLVASGSMLAVTFGKGGVTDEKGKAPGSRARAVAMLRAELIKAREYKTKRKLPDTTKRPPLDLGMEELSRALSGEVPVLATAHRAQDIISALRLAREFKLKLVLDGASDAPLVLDEIKAAGCPVVLHPTMARATEETENLSRTTAAKLHAAAIPFAIQSGFEAYVPKTRVILFEAAIAAAHGLPYDAAITAITLTPAQLLGLAEQTGSIEVGKEADLALYDGDPLEYTTHCLATLIDGVVYPGENYPP